MRPSEGQGKRAVSRVPAGTPHNPRNLAEINPDGSIWVNPRVPEDYQGIKLRQRVYVYEDTVRRARRSGKSESEARTAALKESHKGLSDHQVEVMEGKLGNISKSA